jgi:hypothetical protein
VVDRSRAVVPTPAVTITMPAGLTGSVKLPSAAVTTTGDAGSA